MGWDSFVDSATAESKNVRPWRKMRSISVSYGQPKVPIPRNNIRNNPRTQGEIHGTKMGQ